MRSEYASCAGDIFAQEGLRLPILAEHGKRGSEVQSSCKGVGTSLWCSPRLADKVASLPLVPVVVIMAIYIAVQAFVPAMNPSPRNSAGAC